MLLERINFIRLISILFALVALVTHASAKEVITHFDSNIVIEANGDITVTETIRVIAENVRIKRGIYRDFPTTFEDDNGRIKSVAFDVVSVKRDGKPDDWHSENGSSFTRIYIGNKSVYVARGPHTYEIVYKTDRQMRFFEGYDEFLWNVTGTEWLFPIEKATARVILPDNIEMLETIVFTGKYGSKDQFAEVSKNENSSVLSFATTQPLAKRAGLTIGIKMKKGSFEPVPAGKAWQWFWRDYIGEVAGVLGLLLTSAYYFIQWSKVGRDPPGGVVVPRWDASDEMSPALTNYIDKKGFGSKAWTALSAALLNLAVKGYVVIDIINDKPTITRTDKAIKSSMPVGEFALVDYLDGRKSRSIRAIKSQGTSVSVMQTKFKSAITSEHRKAYYNHNWGTITVGIILSVLTIFAILFTGGVNGELAAVIFPVVFAAIAGSFIFNKLATVFRSGSGLLGKIVSVFFSSFFLFAIVSGGIGSFSVITDYVAQPVLLICIAGIVILNMTFFFLLGAPTPVGREKMDILEGLKTYLILAEKDRMNLAGAPTMSPEHYETLLPYAVALGVEKPWSKSFQSWLLTAAAGAAGAAAGYYAPGWYRGRIGADSISDTFGDMADNMQSSFTASLPTPKSSSSGFSGGGSSGGGGGGGGGGGW